MTRRLGHFLLREKERCLRTLGRTHAVLGPSASVTAGHIELLMVPALEVVHRCNYRFLEPMDVGNPRVGVCLHPFLR